MFIKKVDRCDGRRNYGRVILKLVRLLEIFHLSPLASIIAAYFVDDIDGILKAIIHLLTHIKLGCGRKYIGEIGRHHYDHFIEDMDSACNPDIAKTEGQHYQLPGHHFSHGDGWHRECEGGPYTHTMRKTR